MRSIRHGFQVFFQKLGAWSACRPCGKALGASLGLLILGLGLLCLRVENDVSDLWISQKGRINSERSFYEDNFELKNPQVGAFIIEGKPGHENVLHEGALKEVQDLQEWIRVYEYGSGETGKKPVSLENICYKPLNREPQEPCFQFSVLDCFQEGKVFNVGGKFNSKYNSIYSVRESFRGFNISEDFTEDYIKQHCVQWTNVGTASSMLLGGVTKGVNSRNETVVMGAKALRVVFGTKSPKALVHDGLMYTKYAVVENEHGEGGEICPDVEKCEECVEGLDLDTAARAGCIPGPVEQPDSCCELMGALRRSPCISTLFQSKPDVRALGNVVFGACSLPTVELEKRCSNEILMPGPASGKAGGDKHNDEHPAVCICLEASGDPECSSAVIQLLGEMPDMRDVFLAAQAGEQESIEEVERFLIEDMGCVEENDSDVPDVCTCLVDTEDLKCQSGVVEVLTSRPDLSESFVAAGSGDFEAQAYIAGILVQEYGCSFARRRLLDRKSTGNAYEDDDLEESKSRKPKKMERTQSHNSSPQTHLLDSREYDEGVTADSEPSYSVHPTIVQEGVQSESQARTLLHSWEHAWQGEIASKVSTYQYINVRWAASSSLSDATKEAGKAQAPLLGLGYLLVLGYVIIFFSFECTGRNIQTKLTPPGPFVAMLGFFTILFGVVATFGIIGFLSLSPIKASAITLQIVPLLMVGLGINDFFVLAKSLEAAVDALPAGSCAEIMKKAMVSGGTSITLSSAANAAAFALGALSPIPAIQWFSLQMMIGVLVAYLVSITVIPCILAWATQRWVDDRPDPFLSLCVRHSRRANSCMDDDGDESPSSPMTTSVKPRFADKPPSHAAKTPPFTISFKLVVLGVYAGLLGVSIWGISSLGQGLNGSQAVPKDGDLYKYLKPSEEYFQAFPVYVVFRDGEDVSKPEVFEDERRAEYDFVVDGYRVDVQSKVTSWMEYYMQYVEGKMCANEICMNEVEWVWDGFSSKEFGEKDICKRLDDVDECPDACKNHCPQGPIGSQFECRLSDDERSCYCPWRPVLKQELFYENPDGYDSSIPSFWADFLANTTGGAVAQNLVNLDTSMVTAANPFGRPVASRSLAFVEDVPDVKEKLRHLKKGRAILDNSPADAFAFDYTVYGIGEQYDHLPERTSIAVAISIVVASIIMMPLISNIFTVLIVTICILSATTISAGLSHFLGLDLNYALYVSLVVAVGLAVEFCAHIAREFMVTTGDRGFRSRMAVKNMGVAAMNGGITTWLGLLPVAWTEFPYFQIYFFRQYSLIVAVGLFIGLGLLPVLLSIFGPPPYDNAKSVTSKNASPFQLCEMPAMRQTKAGAADPSEGSQFSSAQV